MKNVRISAIAAIGENRELGRDNELLWKIPADFKRMQELTKGHTLIMGRKTHESIGRPLPNRTNIVITRDSDYVSKGCVIVHSLEEALSKGAEAEKDNAVKEIFIFGGAQIYADALPQTNRLYLTKINDSAPDADTFFPTYDEFTNIIEDEHGESENISYSFLTLERAS